MAISREKKEQLVEEYKQLLEKSNATIWTEYAGLSVKEMEGLRQEIREAVGEFHVVKNSLIKLAYEAMDFPIPENGLEGEVAVGFAMEDVPPVAKAIADMAKDRDSISVKGGVVNGEIFTADQIKQLAELPPLDVLRAQLLGLINTPATQIAGVLAGSARQVLNVLNAYSEKEPAAEAA